MRLTRCPRRFLLVAFQIKRVPIYRYLQLSVNTDNIMKKVILLSPLMDIGMSNPITSSSCHQSCVLSLHLACRRPTLRLPRHGLGLNIIYLNNIFYLLTPPQNVKERSFSKVILSIWYVDVNYICKYVSIQALYSSNFVQLSPAVVV